MYIYTARGSCNKPSLFIAMCIYVCVYTYTSIYVHLYRTGRRRQAEPEGSTTEKPLRRSSRTLSCARERVGRKLEAPKSVVPPYGARTRTLKCILRAHACIHTWAHSYVAKYVPSDSSLILYIYIYIYRYI